MEDLETLKTISQIITGFASPIIAGTLAYIGFQQWKINRQKELRESTESKLQIYLAVKRFLSGFCRTKVIDANEFKDFRESIALGDFILEEPLREWLGTIEHMITVCIFLDGKMQQYKEFINSNGHENEGLSDDSYEATQSAIVSLRLLEERFNSNHLEICNMNLQLRLRFAEELPFGQD